MAEYIFDAVLVFGFLLIAICVACAPFMLSSEISRAEETSSDRANLSDTGGNQ